MKGVVGEVLISAAEIERRVAEMAARLSEDYRDRAITIVGILKGSVVFIADLIRQIDPAIPIELEFMTVSSYGDGTTSSGNLHIAQDLDAPVEGKDVLLVEDIVDTGLTISRVQ